MQLQHDKCKVLTVVDRFELPRVGLAVAPDFPVTSGTPDDLGIDVTIERPDGTCITAGGMLQRWHFNIPNEHIPNDMRRRMVLSLQDVAKEDVPPGSAIWVSAEVAAAILAPEKA